MPSRPEAIAVSRVAARRFLVHAFGLNGFQTLPDVHAVLETLGFVQEDSIHVCGRIHDLILWARVRGYSPGALIDYLYGETPRRAFEYYLPNLCILPLRDFPYFLPQMLGSRERESRWGRLTTEEEAAVQTLHDKLDADGPLFLRDAKEIGAAHGHTTSGWGTRTRLLSFVADKLFYHGRVGIARREGFLRAFDRIERLLPSEILKAPVPSDAEAQVYLLRKKLRAKRLFRLRASDNNLLEPGEIAPVQIEGDKRTWYVFRDDLDLLVSNRSVAPDSFHFLAPLDPLVYDRDRNRLLWDFDYTWEVYVPAPKRKWGYYVLPILHSDQLVGRIEPRIDKKTGTVSLLSVEWESGADATALRPLVDKRLADMAILACA